VLILPSDPKQSNKLIQKLNANTMMVTAPSNQVCLLLHFEVHLLLSLFAPVPSLRENNNGRTAGKIHPHPMVQTTAWITEM
jgi:hypothetical protein